ncbi:hypothetical protein HOI71_01100, partial [Candidatus Poribacteria bacterium]|nr:hypothetical protein [Candidatus Poribacteria bacterium]
MINRALEAGVETRARVDGMSNTAGSVASPLVDGDVRTAIWATEASVVLPVPRPVSRIDVRAPDVIDMDVYIRESRNGRYRRVRRFTNSTGRLRVKLAGSPTLDGVEVRVRRSATDVQLRREEWRAALGDAGARAVRGLMRREERHLWPKDQRNGWGVLELEAITEEPVRPPVSYVRARIYEIELLGPTLPGSAFAST